MSELKYSELENADEYPDLPAVLLLLDGVQANLKCIISADCVQQSGKSQTLAGVIAVLNYVHYQLENIRIVPF